MKVQLVKNKRFWKIKQDGSIVMINYGYQSSSAPIRKIIKEMPHEFAAATEFKKLIGKKEKVVINM